jgi:cell division protease FtsH
MVMTYGMSEKLGPLKFGRTEGDVFLGRDLGHERDFSEEVASQIDDEVRELIERAHDEAWEILVQYRDVLDDLVLKLLDKETLSKTDLAEIFASVDKRPLRQIELARKLPKGGTRPPVLTPAELALMGPKDVPELAAGNGNGNGSRSRATGSRNGSRSTASARARANRTAKSAETPTPRKRTTRRQAPGTTA